MSNFLTDRYFVQIQGTYVYRQWQYQTCCHFGVLYITIHVMLNVKKIFAFDLLIQIVR